MPLVILMRIAWSKLQMTGLIDIVKEKIVITLDKIQGENIYQKKSILKHESMIHMYIDFNSIEGSSNLILFRF